MTEKELAAKQWADILAECPLERDHKNPLAFAGVQNTQMSIARFYGGIEYNGKTYIYDPIADYLIRMDAFTWAQKRKKQTAQKTAPAQTGKQPGLFED